MTSDALATAQHGRSALVGLKRALKIVGIALLVLVALILLLGLLPSAFPGLASRPAPAKTYAEAIARFEDIRRAEQGVVNDASGSVLLTHGQKTPRAYVMVHGTTNSPRQWQELGETLYGQGNNVLILRLPYHGLQSHQVSELAALTPGDLASYADQAVDIAAGLGDQVGVIGISGGGAVGAWMAQNRPEVKQTVLLSPFFGMYSVPGFANTWAMNLFSRLPNYSTSGASEAARDWAYRGEATRGVAAFLGLGHEVTRQASAGVKPAGKMSVITSARDDAVNNGLAAGLVDTWRGAGAQVSTYEFDTAQNVPHNSIGPLVDDAIRHLVYDQILTMLGEQKSQ